MVPVRLRGHHFLCILTYRGFGYSPAFVDNMSRIVASIGAGRPVLLSTGPDDICNGLTPECRVSCDHDCSLADTLAIDRLAVEAVAPLLSGPAGEPMVLDAETIARLRAGFATGALRAACIRCPWSTFCDTIAAEAFSGTKLHPPASILSATE